MAAPEPPRFDDAEDLNYWSSRLFNPPRAQMERALEVPEAPDRAPPGLTLGAWRAWRESQQEHLAREHWENLYTRGLVDDGWLANEQRFFTGFRAVHDPKRGGSSTTYEATLFAHPATLDAAIALASDMPNVRAVDELVREAWRRQWVFLPPYLREDRELVRGIVWDVCPTPSYPGYLREQGCESLRRALIVAFYGGTGWDDGFEQLAPESLRRARQMQRSPLWGQLSAEARRGFELRGDTDWLYAAVALSRVHRLFERACELELAYPALDPPAMLERSRSPSYERFCDIAENPFTPQLEIFERGYAFYGFDYLRNMLRVAGRPA